MTQDEIVEAAILGHASTRDAIKWAMAQEREACAKVVDELPLPGWREELASAIRARGEK